MIAFKFLNVEQNTPEWFDLRAGKLTSSKLGTIMANYPNAFGAPAKKYAVNLALEKINKTPISSEYNNSHMERGHEQEPLARELYEDEHFCTVDNGGFFYTNEIGCSPDGLVGNDGVIEIKSVVPSVHFMNVKRGGFDPAYKWQVIGNLLFTGRQWIDFISFSLPYPRDKQLYTYRVHLNDVEQEIKQITIRINQFLELVKNTKSLILNSNYCILNEKRSN